MSSLSKILTILLSLGPKAPQAIAILRRLYADGQALIAMLFPEGLPTLSVNPLPDGTLGLTLNESFSEDEIALEGMVLSLVSEHGSTEDTQELIQAGTLLKILAFLNQLGLTDALLALLSKLGK